MNSKIQILMRGLWMSALFWPYTHGGGFHNATFLALTPFWLSLGDLWSQWILQWGSWIVVIIGELAVEWASLPSLRHIFVTFSRSIVVLHHLSFANWNQISAHIATPLLLIGAFLGWHVFRQARSSKRITTFLVIGIIILVTNHVFWQLPTERPLFAYAALGLLLLSYSQILNRLSASRLPRAVGVIVATMTIFVPLMWGWKATPKPGHTLGVLGENIPALRFLSGNGATTGYSNAINHIGQSVIPDYHPVMIVHSKAPHYWQAEIFNTFTGKVWTDPGSNAVQITPEDSGIPLFSLSFNTSQVPATTDTVTFQSANGRPFHTLFYPGVPLSFGSHPASMVLYPNKEQFVSSHTLSYRVTSIVPHFNAALLNRVTFGEYPIPHRVQDVQLPHNLSPRVSQLAVQITRHAQGPWQAALDIKQYLDTHYRYSFHVTPTHTNVVNHFLFRDKAGYCDQFSTAFIMMARSLGIPARWVVGYAPGTYDAHDHGYVIRAIDAHSWAQVYIAPFGWVPIDPTPGFTITDLARFKAASPSAHSAAPQPITPAALPKVHTKTHPAVSHYHISLKPAHTVRSDRLHHPHSTARDLWWMILLPAMLATAIFGLITVRHRSRRYPRSSALRLWHQVKWWTRFKVHTRVDNITPREWLGLWNALVTSNPQQVRQLVTYLESGLYGPSPWSDQEAQQARHLWWAIRFAANKSRSKSAAS